MTKRRRDRERPGEEPQGATAPGAETEGGGEPRLVRLNKFLADHGVASRRRCDELIAEGKVSVDGEPATELGLKVDPQRQEVEIDGYVLKPRTSRRRYYVLNKPSGVVCTNDARETRPRAVDLVTDPFKGRIYTVGRLDEESKGLILLTSDGEFANRIMHPRFGVAKTYLVKVVGAIDDDTLNKIRDGIHLSEGRTAGARVIVQQRGRDHSLLTIELREGMNREIRRVFARFGYKVLDLKRIRIGPLTDRGLKPGRWRELTPAEVAALLRGETAPPEAEREGGRRPRGRAPFGAPRRTGYARHLVRGGRAVERREDAAPRAPGGGRRFPGRGPGGPGKRRAPGARTGPGGGRRGGRP
jgi:23S rRNA pseudouridine2605 synthase